MRLATLALFLLPLLPPAGLVHHVYFDDSDLPDIEPFIRFEPPTIGEVYDARGQVLIETHAPAAIESVFDELTQHGGDCFGVEDLFLGRVSVRATVDERVQTIVNEALLGGGGHGTLNLLQSHCC